MTRRALTLIELLVVLAAIGVLVGLLMPAVQSARASAQRAACQNTLRQVGVALHGHESAHGRFPPEALYAQTLSWMVALLPHLELDPLYHGAVAAAKSQPNPTVAPHAGFATPVRVYVCPADGRLGVPHEFEGRTAAFASYLGLSGLVIPPDPYKKRGVFGGVPGIPVTAITDGTSHTVAVVERPPPNNFQAGWWYPDSSYWGRSGPHVDLVVNGESRVEVGDGCSVLRPFGPGRLDNVCDRLRVWSLHPAGANFLFADGSVHFFGYGFAEQLPAAATIAQGDTVTLPD